MSAAPLSLHRQPAKATRARLFALCLLLAWATLLLANTATATIVDGGDGKGNTTAPDDDPGWSNIGSIGHLTGIYLGNGWVLTAGHVRVSEFVIGRRSYAPVQGELRHPIYEDKAAGIRADLHLFQIRDAPKLHAIKLGSVPTLPGQKVLMVGNGRNRAEARSAWDLNWNATRIERATYLGYESSEGNTLRWGTNTIEAVRLMAPTGDRRSRTFATRFDRNQPTPFEAQGASGDSGGPVFYRAPNGEWELIGIMVTIGQHPNQPRHITAYGNSTYSVDLFKYKDQIEAILASRPDHDGDGILDIHDNCTQIRNPTQGDLDRNGIGDACQQIAPPE